MDRHLVAVRACLWVNL